MLWIALTAMAVAGPLGPFASDLADTGGAGTAPSCGEAWPYELVALPHAPDLYQRWDPTRSYGTPALIAALSEATARVAALHPEADPVFVGDLSLARGGPLPPHRYHSDGRSADLGLYSSDGAQPLDGGFRPVWGEALDVERTWELIEALLDTGMVEHVLLDQHHIDRIVRWLRAEGRMSEESLALTFPPVSTPRLWSWRGIVRHAPRHVDHLHVRIACE